MADGLHIVNTVDNSQVDNAFARMRKGIMDSAQTAEQQGKRIDASFVRVAASISGSSDTIMKKLYVEQNAVNGITKRIIDQKAVIRDMQAEVSRLGDAYKSAKKSGSSEAAALLAQYNSAKKALDEERGALFRLNQERANASLRCRELRNQLELKKKSTEHVKETVDETTESVDLLTKSLIALGGAAMLKGLVSKIVSIRGEFQQLEVAFKTMLGSEEKAVTLMNQMVKTAAITPFDLKGVTDGAKQLLAYGVAAEEVNDTLLHLGDIAAGLSLPLSDLVYLYGTTITQGRMYTMDLRQFMGRGIPLAEELAKQFGVTKDKVGELVTAGKVGAEEFKKAIMDMSSEGGKFGGLMEEQSKTITGQISNLEDAIDVMFNEIGKNSEGVISGAISVAASLVENYERVGRILLSLVATYGTYKAAIIAVTAMKGWATAAEALHYNWLLLVEKAQKMLNATMLANPYVLVATLIAGVAAALISMKTQTELMKEADEKYEQKKQEVISAEEEHIRKIKELCDIAYDEAVSTDTRRRALNKLEQKYPAIFAKYDSEYEKLKNIKKIKEEIAELEGKKSIKKPENELREVQKRIQELCAIGHYVDQYGMSNGNPHAIVGRKWVSTRSSAEEAELQNLYKKTASLHDQIRKDAANEFFANLTGVSNKDLEDGIKRRKDLLAQIAMFEQQGKKANGNITSEGETTNGVFTKDELQYQLNKLNDELNKRNAERSSSTEWVAEAKKKYEDALKAYNDFIKNKSNELTKEEFEKQSKELKDSLDAAKKEYDKVKPQTDKDGETAKKKREQQQKEQARFDETRRKQMLKAERDAIDMEHNTRQSIINEMEDGAEKTLLQLRLDFDKQEEAIKRGYEDLKQAKIDNARKLWEADPANKGKAFDASTVDVTYTEAEAAYNAEQKRENLATYLRKVRETLNTEKKYMLDYLESYGSIQQRKLAIASEYNEKIAKEQNEWNKKMLERERDKRINEIHSNNLLESINYETLFSEYGAVLASPLKETLAALEEYTQQSAFKERSIEDQKTIYKAISEARKQLNGIQAMSFTDISRALSEYNNALMEYNISSKRLGELAEDVLATEEALRKAEEELAKATSNEAKEIAQANLNIAKAKNAQAKSNYNAGEKTFNNAQSNLVRTQTEATRSLENFEQSIENVGDAARALASGSMKQLWDALGKKTQKRIYEFLTGTRTFHNALDELTAKLTEQGTSMNDFVQKIQNVATEIFNAGNDIENSEIGKKISEMLSNVLSDDEKGAGKIGKKITEAIENILAKKSGEGADAESVGKEVGDAVTKVLQTTSSSGSLWGMIIGLVFDLLDVLAEGIGNLVDVILTKVGDAVSGILTEIGSGKFFVNIAEGIGNVIAGVVKGVANLFSLGLAFGNSNEDDMNEVIEKMAIANEALALSIDSLTEQLKNNDNTNAQSIDAYKKAKAAEEEWEANQRKAMNAEASKWTNIGYGFLGLGGKHSFNYYANDKSDLWSQFNDVLKQHGYEGNIQSAGDIWKLSPEEMRVLRDFAPSAWAELFKSDGHGNPLQLANDYIARAGTLDALTSALNEQLTGYSWDGFKDSFANMLKDLSTDTEDFAANIENLITNALINAFINSEAMQGRIKALYEKVAKYASEESDGGTDLTKEELDDIRKDNEAIANDMLNWRKAAIAAGLIKEVDSEYSQKASSKGFQAMSQDTGEELNGRFTAIQIAAYDIKDLVTAQNEMIARLEQQGGGMTPRIEAIQTALATSNIHLADISKYTKNLIAIGETLEEIRDNTKHL